MTDQPKAYSYLRFSTPEQAKGDSYRRQTERAQAYAARHDLALDEDLTFEDLGVSAFHGKNARTGALRAFNRAVEDGIILPGSYLLVESLDRISRENVLDAQARFIDIINSGITVVTLVDQRVYSRETINANPTDLILSLVVMMRARDESQAKADRIQASWSNKRKKAQDGVAMTVTGPSWLDLGDDGTWKVDLDKAAVVRRIFEELGQGVGVGGIAKQLNQERVPPIGRRAPTAKPHATMWHPSYIQKLRNNPAVVGTFVPHINEHDGSRNRRVPQEPIPGYYPAIISEELWQDVQALRATRSGLRGRTKGKLTNVLGGLGKCPECDASMVQVNKGPRSKRKLVCSRARVGAAEHPYRSVDLEAIEEALRAGMGQAVAEAPDPNGHAGEALERLEATIAGQEDAIDRLIDALVRAGGSSPAIAQRLRDAEATLRELQGEREDLQRQVLLNDPKGHQRRQLALIDAFASEGPLSGSVEPRPLDIGKANTVLRQAAKAVVVNYPRGTLDIQWLAKGESEIIFGMPPVE